VSDEIPETADKAIRLWLAAIGFTLVLVGGEMMAEKDGARFGIGLALVIVALPVHLAWVFWQRLKVRLGRGVVLEIGTIATSPRWWFALLFVLLSALIFTPVIQTPRWPTVPFSRTALTTVSTFMRLQFNASGEQPEEIARQNIDWTTQRYIETVKSGEHKRRICTEITPSPPQPYTGTLQIMPIQPSYNCSDETFPEYVSHRYVMFILTFPKVIQLKEIKINSHGAGLPNWKTISSSDNSAVIRFDGELSRMILDVEVLN
jgi:hypothetical protein